MIQKNSYKTNNPYEFLINQEMMKGENQFFQDILDAIVHPFYVINADDYTIEMANAAAMVSPFTEESTCYAITHKRSSPCKGKDFLCPLRIIKETKKPVMVEHVHWDRSGNKKIFEVHAYPIFDEKGNVKKIIEHSIDITQRKIVEEDLKQMHTVLQREKLKLEQVLGVDQKISAILRLNHLVDFIIEKAAILLEADKCSLMLLDQRSNELSIRGAKGLDDKIIKTTRIKLGQPIAGAIAEAGKPVLIRNIEHEGALCRKKRASYRSKSFISVPITLHERLVGLVNVADKNDHNGGVFSELDLQMLMMIVRQAAIAIENANYCRRLEHLTISDPLTGIFNYRYFITRLDQEIDRAKRYARPLCLMMIDIDDFKSFNDQFGHLAGDHLLKQVCSCFKEHLRVVDVFCRYAGDEFVVILPETDLKHAEIVAEKLIRSVKDLTLERPVSVSVGMAERNNHFDRRDLLMKADQALYQAKKEGKNKVCYLS